MNAIEVAQNNFNSWNRHDADAIVAAYAKGGTYRTPRMGHDLTGQAIGDFAKSVWAAFPDASLEMISIGDTGGGLVARAFQTGGYSTFFSICLSCFGLRIVFHYGASLSDGKRLGPSEPPF